MATLYGAQATLLLNQTIPYNIPAQYQNARMKVYIDSYTLPASTDFGATDLIKFFKLPLGGLVVDAVLDCGAFGGSCAGKLGSAVSTDSGALEAADDDSLILSGSLATAARSRMTTEAFKNHVLLAEVQVQFLLSAVSSSAGGKILTAAVHVLQPAGV